MKRGAVLLAGGASRRMGHDKALLLVDGEPLLHRTCSRLASVPGVSDLAVACGLEARIAPYRAALADLRLPPRFAVDPIPGRGPVAGLAAGLLATPAAYAAVAPVDAPDLAPSVVERLFERAEAERADGAVVLRDGRLEVLFGVFARFTSGHFLAALAHGVEAAHRAVEGLDLVVVDEQELRGLDPEGRHWTNLNGPDEVARYMHVG